MKVSIIIPVYNVSDYVERCIYSVINQTYSDLECIIVDDCTPDDSIEKCEKIIANYNGPIDFVIIHHNHNRGLSAARNTGIDAAKGEYVYFLDSDDEISNDCITTLSEPLKNKFYDVIIGDYQKIDDGGLANPSGLSIEGEICGVRNIANHYMNEHWYCMAVNKMCNISFLKSKNLFFKEGIIHEDELWSAQIACSADSLFSVKKKTYFYHIREKSIMSQKNKEEWLYNVLTVLNEVYLFQEANRIYFVEIDGIENRLRSICYWIMSTLNYSSYKKYSIIRKNDIRSLNTKNKIYKSLKSKILSFDVFLPIIIGFIYKRCIDKYFK